MTAISRDSSVRMARQTLLAHLVREREILLRDARRILGSRDRAEDVLQEGSVPGGGEMTP